MFPAWPRRERVPVLARLRAAGLLKGASGQVRTPGDGLHVYFAGSGQRTGHLPACHVDFLAKGGYVILPPSQVNPVMSKLGRVTLDRIQSADAGLPALQPPSGLLPDRHVRGAL